MRDKNEVTLIGRIEEVDPPSYTSTGKLVVKARFAVVSERGPKKVVMGTAFGDTAQIIQSLHLNWPNGRVLVSGVIESRPYTGKDGTQRWNTDFVVYGIGNLSTQTETSHPKAPSSPAPDPFTADDVPF